MQFASFRRARTRLCGILAAAVALAFVFSAGQVAAEENKDLDSVLKNIDWGDSKDDVLQKLRQQMMSKLRKRDDLRHDRVKMQQARKRVMDKFERIENSYTELKGDTTGYKVSVIADEFTKNNNEALLKIDDKVAQRFFFFADGSLYKMIVAYKQNYLNGVGFESFIGQVSKKYGRPDETKQGTINDEETMVRAIWKDEKTRLRAKNQKEFFGTYALVFSDKNRVDRMKAKKDSFGGSDKDPEKVSSRVEALKKDSGKDANANVVDGMVGESVEVDLRRNDKDLEKQGPAGKTASKKKKKKKVAEKDEEADQRREKQQQQQKEQEDDDEERDFSDIGTADEEKKKDDELIIY